VCSTNVPNTGGSWLAHDVLGVFARETPDAPALASANEQVSYGLAYDRVQRLAYSLKAEGLTQEDRVAVLLPRGTSSVIAMLAILAAGGCYVPVDVTQPVGRIKRLVETCNARFAVVPQDGAHEWFNGDVKAISQPLMGGRLDSGTFGLPAFTGNSLAYIIHTSGSTGTPKQVMISHGSLSNLVTAQREAFCLDSSDRMLLWASSGFDASIYEVFLALGVGARLYVASEDEAMPGPSLTGVLERERISALTITPSAWARTLPGQLRDLKLLSLAGEPLSANLARQWSGGGRRLFNLYGPTECTVWSSYKLVDDSFVSSDIGQAIRGVSLKTLDCCGDSGSVGERRELLIGGKGVALGYAGAPRETAAAFVPDPNALNPGGRVYRSGDLTELLASGDRRLIGRIDRQLKVRGFRVDPPEIEHAIRDCAGVQDCAVLPFEEPAYLGEVVRSLAAFVVSESPIASLRESLQTVLPNYMLPTRFLFIDRLPLTPGGKADYKRLSGLLDADGSSFDRHAQLGVQSSLQEYVSDLWASVLPPAEDLAVTSFLGLGGHSLAAVQVAQSLASELEVTMTAAEVLQSSSVEAMSRLILSRISRTQS